MRLMALEKKVHEIHHVHVLSQCSHGHNVHGPNRVVWQSRINGGEHYRHDRGHGYVFLLIFIPIQQTDRTGDRHCEARNDHVQVRDIGGDALVPRVSQHFG